MVTILYTKGSKSRHPRLIRAIPIEIYCSTVEAQCHSIKDNLIYFFISKIQQYIIYKSNKQYKEFS